MTLADLPPMHPLPPGVRGLLRHCFPNWQSLGLAVLTCVVIPASLIAVHVAENPMLSPIDETAHFDYVNRIAEGSLPRLGELVLPSTQRVVDCRRVALYGLVLQPCGATGDITAGDYQYEAQQPPTYYAVTAALRVVPEDVLGIDPLDATRLTGILWLAAGLLLIWGTGRLLELTPETISIGVLMLAAAPVVVYESSIVSNEASALLAGGLMSFLAALAWRRRGRWGPPALGVGSLVVCTLDTVNFLVVGVVALLFAIAAVADASPTDHPSGSLLRRVVGSTWTRHAAAMVAGGAVSVVGWLIVFHTESLINPRDLPSFAVLRTGAFGLSTALSEAVSMLAPLTGSYAAYRTNASAVPPGTLLSQNLQVVTAAVFQYMFVAGALAWLFVRERQWCHWLGLVALPALYVGGVALGTSIHVTYDVNPGLSGRYGLCVAPVLTLGLIGSLRGRWPIRILGSFALTAVGLSFYFMLAA